MLHYLRVFGHKSPILIQIRILQLGDVHMGMVRETEVDIKDRLFPASVASLTTRDPLVSAMRFAVSLIRESPVDAILIVGDLTHQGDADHYNECVKYLVELLLKEWCENNAPAFCVPGNHDVNRSGVSLEVNVDTVWEKFRPLEEAWRKHNLPIIATDEIKSLALRKGGALADILALNSCLGCGEYRGLPEELRAAAHASISGTSDTKTRWTSIEQIDSPSFSIDHIHAAQQKIDGENKINVVLAHHNLLPQSTPRAALYSELLNGGQLRSIFTQARSPTVYCHGHTHDDSVEVVTSPPSLTATISIGAPFLDKGFNVIELVYSDNGLPLGVIIEKFKVGKSHTFSRQPHEEIRIPFRSSGEYFPLYQPPRSTIINAVRANGGIRFPSLLRIVKEVHDDITSETLGVLLQEAEWYGIIKLFDRSKDCSYWQITQMSP